MKIVKQPIDVEELLKMSKRFSDEYVKAVVDIEHELMAVDADMHADLETFLIDHGSKQFDLWGINIYPNIDDDSFVEFDSVINLRPSQGNRSRGVDSDAVRMRVLQIVKKLTSR